MAENCLFCKIVNKEIPAAIVFENDDVLAFRDISPQAPTHILIIPKEHIPATDSITPENHLIAGKIISAAVQIAKDLKLEGYRLVFNSGESAGQTVFHIHCHLMGGRNFSWPPG